VLRFQKIGPGSLCRQVCAAGTLYVQVHEAKDLPAAPMLRVTLWRASSAILHSGALLRCMRSSVEVAANGSTRMRHRAFHQSKACAAASCGWSARSHSRCRTPSYDRSQNVDWMWVDAAVLLVVDSQGPTMQCRYVVIRLGGLRVAHTSVWRTPRCGRASTCSSEAYSSLLCH